MTNFERPNIRAMQGYSWGEQPQEAETIKLNTNECPYPPSPQVDQVFAEMRGADLRRYPSPTADTLRDAVAQHHNLRRDQVVITHAGDEALRLAFTTFVEPAGRFGMAEPSYSLYPVLASIQDAELIRIPLTDSWALPTDTASQLNAARVQLTCIVNPHAPSGQLTSASALGDLAIQLNGVLLIDEAYADFVDPNFGYNASKLLADHENVLILRTFSKGYALAGLRLGYLLGNTSLIKPIIEKTRDSYNVDAISQRIGLAAINDQRYAQDMWARVRANRQQLQRDLDALGLSSLDSQTNFLLVDVPNAEDVYLALKERNILVRYFSAPRLSDKLRISVGSEAENQALCRALEDILR